MIATRTGSAPWIVALAAGALLAAVGPSSAQTIAGVRAGVSIAAFTGNSGMNAHTKRGLLAGVVLQRHLVDELSVQAEAVYVQKGADLEAVAGGGSPVGALRLHYIEVPLMLRLDLPLIAHAVSLHAAGGPAVGVNVHCSWRAVGAPADAPCTTVDGDLRVRRFDYSLVGGSGLTVSTPSARVFVDVRYAVGLGTVDHSASPWRRTNHGFAVSGGVAVPVGARGGAALTMR